MNTGFLIQPRLKKEVKPIEYTTMGDFPTVGQQYVYYKALDTGIFYKWDGDSYEVINPAMDVNNQFASVSGLPQATMDNPLDSPTYRVLNTTSCPVDPSEEVTIISEVTTPTPQTGGTNRYGAKFIVSEILYNNLIIDFTIHYEDITYSMASYSDLLTLDVAFLEVETSGYPVIDGSPDGNASVVINSVSPNPNGTKTIIY